MELNAFKRTRRNRAGFKNYLKKHEGDDDAVFFNPLGNFARLGDTFVITYCNEPWGVGRNDATTTMMVAALNRDEAIHGSSK